MQTLTLIATGGTIACRAGEEGLAPHLAGAAFAPFAPAGCRVETVDFLRVDSTDLTVEQQWALARRVKETQGGVVITHGTDTLAYTAPALTHLLRGERRPVILTGSQLPLGAPGSDAEGNLTLAFQAACGDKSGVWVACNGRLLPGDRVTKAHTEDAAAFVERGVSYPAPDRPPAARPVPTGVLLLYPGLSPAVIDAMDCQNLILLALGMGGIPAALLPALARRLQGGDRVYVMSQCPGGAADLTRYAVGRRALRLGVKPLPALTVENALALGRCGLL